MRGGLTFREGHYICEAICETGLLVALDMMVIPHGYPPQGLYKSLLQEVNPSLADEASVTQTVAVGCSLVRCALGERIPVCSSTVSNLRWNRGDASVISISLQL